MIFTVFQDECLDPSYTDAAVVEALHNQVKTAKYRHESVNVLRRKLQGMKVEALEAAEAAQEALRSPRSPRSPEAPEAELEAGKVVAIEDEEEEEEEEEEETFSDLEEEGEEEEEEKEEEEQEEIYNEQEEEGAFECPDGHGPGDVRSVELEYGEIEIETPEGVYDVDLPGMPSPLQSEEGEDYTGGESEEQPELELEPEPEPEPDLVPEPEPEPELVPEPAVDRTELPEKVDHSSNNRLLSTVPILRSVFI